MKNIGLGCCYCCPKNVWLLSEKEQLRYCSICWHLYCRQCFDDEKQRCKSCAENPERKCCLELKIK